MLYLYFGTDRQKARSRLNTEAEKHKADIVRITDAHPVEDLKAALQGGGMFFARRVVIFENLSLNEEMRAILLDALPRLKESEDPHYVFEEKPLADLRKKLEKHAERVEVFDAPKKAQSNSVFALANALKRGDKKGLWVGYVSEMHNGGVPEAIHGVLFWAAKDMCVKSDNTDARARRLVSVLAELPHEARKRGEDLEYALERFVLSGA